MNTEKEFKVLPGITIKYGKGGITTFLHFSNEDEEDAYKRSVEKLKQAVYRHYDPEHEIRSRSIDRLTTKELEPFRELLLQSDTEHSKLMSKLNHEKDACKNARTNLHSLEHSFLKYFFKKKIGRLAEQVSCLTRSIDSLEAQIPLTTISLNIDGDDVFHELYKHILQSFSLLERSERKWDVTSSKGTDMIRERTNAAHTITRTDITVKLSQPGLIKNSMIPFCFHNANGGDLYFYPGFLIVHEHKDSFAIIDYTELDVSFRSQLFIESGTVPSDTKIVDHTWYKVNKDGSPDKRFANNYKIPVVVYGDIHFQSSTGLSEKYSFSNAEFAELFATAFNNYIAELKAAGKSESVSR